jgi:hypothetical protein
VRQLFNVLVAQYAYEKTERAATAALYETLVTARRARRLDWNAIPDDGVNAIQPYARFASGNSFYDWLGREWVDHFELDPRIGQPFVIENWCEAAGLTRQLDRVCDPYGVAVYPGPGFESPTAKLETGQAHRGAIPNTTAADRRAPHRRRRPFAAQRLANRPPSKHRRGRAATRTRRPRHHVHVLVPGAVALCALGSHETAYNRLGWSWDEYDVRIHRIRQMWGLGTPEDLERYVAEGP